MNCLKGTVVVSELEQVVCDLERSVRSWVKATAWMMCGLSSNFSTVEGVW